MYIHLLTMNNSSSFPVSFECMCASFRRASRVLTQLYDDSLRPLGLRTTQLTILRVLSSIGEVSQGELGKALAMDSTSLTRTLRIMLRHGWLQERPGKDRRERRLRLAKPGEEQLKRALPHWQKAQERLRSLLGDRRWRQLLAASDDLTHVVTSF
jgi:DNA-binding MarR family transcriptional regulator